MTRVEGVQLPSIMYFMVFSSKTSFFKLQDIFPECFHYREDSPNIEPLACLVEDMGCTVGRNCMETLCKRLYVLFAEICTSSDLILLYFRKRNYTGLGSGVFWPNLEDAKVITMNPTAWERLKNSGNVYRFDPSRDFFLTGMSAPPDEIQKSEDQVLD
jgi:hypothetical protein